MFILTNLLYNHQLQLFPLHNNVFYIVQSFVVCLTWLTAFPFKNRSLSEEIFWINIFKPFVGNGNHINSSIHCLHTGNIIA